LFFVKSPYVIATANKLDRNIYTSATHSQRIYGLSTHDTRRKKEKRKKSAAQYPIRGAIL